MNQFETVLYSVENRVATIRMSRPDARNAFSTALRRDMMEAIRQADSDDDVRVVVIAAEGRGFSAGADLVDGMPSQAQVSDHIEEEYKPFLMMIHESSKLYISSIQGAAAGGGSAVAMVCDLSIMADNGYIYMAFATLGLVPDCGASWHLVNQLGYKRALQKVVEAEKISAKECLELGLVNKVVAADTLVEETQAWAEKLALGAPLAQRYAKEILRRGMGMTLSEVIDLEGQRQNITLASKDAMEGGMAFFEKRQPKFSGQ
ncbi:MAG: enoyl-CoA hydratase/isomerase family protein [Proteobacteria bacterium]|nr:enoyl-CoA hydratase/isomerase family protein [Pseudomonadota bacterium]